ncbi:MAG: hypothetical protein KGJ90_04670 [Patescibacteria group bacterium]|nr:hypothetical protein [Patescibacteria group bacterium]
MQVIFLDIDGVLNSSLTLKTLRNNKTGMDKGLVAIFNDIVERTGAKVVLSSTWRIFPYWRSAMKIGGVRAQFLDKTAYIPGQTRGYEVKRWLKKHPEVEKYAILDDDDDFYPYQPLFRVKDGLDVKTAEEVIKYLHDN